MLLDDNAVNEYDTGKGQKETKHKLSTFIKYVFICRFLLIKQILRSKNVAYLYHYILISVLVFDIQLHYFVDYMTWTR